MKVVRSVLCSVVLLLSGVLIAVPAQAQNFAAIGSLLEKGYTPFGLAIDGAGDIFVAQNANAASEITGAVFEFVAVNGQVTFESNVIKVTAGLSSPTAVALDSKGDVFVADSGNSSVFEIVAVNGQISSSSSVVAVGSGFYKPFGVAVDAAGDVFVGDTGHSQVKEIVAVNGLVSGTSAVKVVGSGFKAPRGVTVDAAGDVFVGDSLNKAVKEIVAVDGQVSSTSTVNSLGSGFMNPQNVALDAWGNLFVTDEWGAPAASLREILANGGQLSSSSPVHFLTFFEHSGGLAVDGRGDVFSGDVTTRELFEFQLGTTHFGSVNVGSKSTIQIALFDSSAGGWSVYTQGAKSPEFTILPYSYSDGTTCWSGGGNFDCALGVVFTPKHAGLRTGVVELRDSSGNVVATENVDGVGVGPEVEFLKSPYPLGDASEPEPPASFKFSGFSDVNQGGIATDGAGDVFVADYGNNAIKEIVASRNWISSTSQVITLESGLDSPAGIAVDGAGNVFFAEHSASGDVKEIVAVNGQVSSSSSVVTVGSGFKDPIGLAVDPRDDVFVVDNGDKAVKEIVAPYGQVGPGFPVVTIATGFNDPQYIATDSSGNLFVSDATGSSEWSAKEIVAVNGVVSTQSKIVTVANPINLAPPDSGPAIGVAVDPAGQVYLGYGPIALNYAGNIFMAQPESTSLVAAWIRSGPPPEVFPKTKPGSISSGITEQITNIGNTTLTFPLPSPGSVGSTGTNPSLSNAAFMWNSSSTCTQTVAGSAKALTLAPAATCNATVKFKPTATGTITGSLIFTDNNLNAASPSYSTQTVPLSGVAE